MRPFLSRFDLRVSLGYIFIASLWIILSDRLLAFLFAANPAALAQISLLKNLIFVLVTALLLFLVLRVETQKRDRLESALQANIRERGQSLDEPHQEEASQYPARLLASAADAIISTDVDFNIRTWNPAAEAIYGWTAQEVVGKPVRELLQGEYPESTEAEARHTLESERIWRGETIQRRKDGSHVYVLASTSYVTDANADPIGVMSVNRDITERKRIDLALRESEERFRNIADSAPAMLWTSNVDVNVTFANRGWYEFTGQTEATSLGWGWLDALHPDDRPTLRRAFLAANESRSRFQLDYRLRQQSDGAYRRVIATGVPQYSERGEFDGYLGSVMDVTEAWQAQENLQAAELLRVEVAKEKELLNLKERFISVVSHEFRTPLAVMMSAAELVLRYYDRMPRERQLEHVQEILSQAEFMVGLLDDVLTVNKARSGKLEFKPAPLDLVGFCQTTVERIQATDHGTHRLVFTHEGDFSDAQMDVKLLRHILINLLSNAVKYSPGGGDAQLDVSRQNDTVVFRVSDRGIGIPPENLPHIFEPFYRAANTNDIGGTGLGMAIVRESVGSHRGEIVCESTVGVGTTFTVTIPVAASVECDGETSTAD